MLTLLPMASRLAADAVAREARSALPDAPVVPHVEPAPRPARARRSRTVLARALDRAARAVEPACTPGT